MKITLTQPEIEQAVREFVVKGGLSVNGGEMAVEFSMGRGENGLTAAIDVPYMGVASLPSTPVVLGPTPGFIPPPVVTLRNDAAPKAETVVVSTAGIDDAEAAVTEGTSTPVNRSSLFTSPSATPASE